MPHIVVEASAGVIGDASGLLGRLTSCLSEFETIDPSAVKSRLFTANDWVTGDGCPNQFVHTTVSLMEGRDSGLLKRIADAMFEVVRKEFSISYASGEVAVTLEVREMASETYRK